MRALDFLPRVRDFFSSHFAVAMKSG
jgi:hypothetical protein